MAMAMNQSFPTRTHSAMNIKNFQSIHIHLYAPQDQRFSIDFENFSELVSKWDGMYFEMDGSFVWVDRKFGRNQLDGMVYDRDGAIEYLELKGNPSSHQLNSIFDTVTCKESTTQISRLRIFDVRSGNWMNEIDFASWQSV